MDIATHDRIDKALCGKPLLLAQGFSRVELVTTPNMAVDQTGLVHGGFIFGLADYAAMIAVNHPNVVLGSAETKFWKPVAINETVTAEARLEPGEGKKKIVTVKVQKDGILVFEGVFTCFVTDRHVLA